MQVLDMVVSVDKHEFPSCRPYHTGKLWSTNRHADAVRIDAPRGPAYNAVGWGRIRTLRADALGENRTWLSQGTTPING